MRAVLQRVTSASVAVQGATIASIGAGLLVLVANEEADASEDVEWLAGRIVNLAVFPDDAGALRRSVAEMGGEILLVSQFTLFASTKKGRRPSWHRAAKPEVAKPLYESLARCLGGLMGRPIRTGRFGATMEVTLVNSGPVTLMMDSKVRE
jgi:D-tyrosyl-tRNA(Tyr) deacylase